MFHLFREGYRGVVAIRDIPKGVVLLRIGRSCCIGPQTSDSTKDEWREAMSSSEIMGIASNDSHSTKPRLSKACFTVLRILHELGLGEASPFHSYLSVLPQDHRIPIEWNAAELSLLKSTAAEPLVGAGTLQNQFVVFEQMVARHPKIWVPNMSTKDMFARAVNWVRSRGFTVFGEPYMIPGADMFNHDPDHQSVQFATDEDDHFIMQTVHPVNAGEELFSSFGHLSNAQLLNSYGFILPGNPFDTVLIPRELVIECCHKIFISTEGGSSMEDEADTVWQQRLSMVDNLSEFAQAGSAFLISKYDLLPEDLAEMVQILIVSSDPEVVYGTIASIAQAKLGQYSSAFRSDESTHASAEGEEEVAVPGGMARRDALSLARMLVAEEKKILKDLRVQLMTEVLEGSDEDEDEGDKGASAKKQRTGP
ncbi:unnamed protein product [Choristocarpus tenellus]